MPGSATQSDRACATSGGTARNPTSARNPRIVRYRMRIANQRGNRFEPIGRIFCRSMIRISGLNPIASSQLT